jgi:uncharacterized heparinase superfamily protein
MAEHARAAWRGLARQGAEEWRASPFGQAALAGPKPRAAAAFPRDLRPPEPDTGRAILAGRITLVGAVLSMPPGGDPWDTPSPTRRFAEELHRFSWLSALLALGEAGEREALRLTLDWETLFGRPTPFPWSAEVLERRIYHWACGLKALLARASDAEGERLLAALARQTRWLLTLDAGPARAAERAVVAAIAAASLEPRAGAKLLGAALERLAPALKVTVLADGGHRSRSPQAGLELLLDLLTLDDVLEQRGRAAPPEASRALDRLTSATRFFTLGDGALAAFQGGEAVEPARVSAARAREENGAVRPFAFAPHAGYQRLSGRRLQAMIDAGAPAAGEWSVGACAQLLAMEVTAGRDRLIVNSGWSPDAAGPAALRLASGGSTLTLDDASPGTPLSGWRADALGPQIVGAPQTVDVRRNEDDADNVWIELSHEGWAHAFGHVHERRLYLDSAADELRGEDRLSPRAGRGRAATYAVRFHLHPDVKASLALDGRSLVLRAPAGGGWRLRHDAGSAALEATAVFGGGLPRKASQIVLRGQVLPELGARVRWKLSPVEGDG